jgi:hypothetical protein
MVVSERLREEMSLVPTSAERKGLAIAIGLAAFAFAGCQSSSSTIPPTSLVEHPSPVVIPEGPTVAFCDLVSNPKLYDKKMVRMQAIAVGTSELQFLYDPECNGKEAWIDLEFDSQETLEKVWPLLDFSLGRHAPRRAKVTVVGQFDGPNKEGYGHLNSFRFHFRVMAVEKAEAVPAAVPGPWDVTK